MCVDAQTLNFWARHLYSNGGKKVDYVFPCINITKRSRLVSKSAIYHWTASKQIWNWSYFLSKLQLFLSVKCMKNRFNAENTACRKPPFGLVEHMSA